MGEVSVDFPLVLGSIRLLARVVSWHAVQESPTLGEPEDIAVLEFDPNVEMLAKAQPAQLVTLDEPALFDRSVRVCGFPEGMDAGDWVGGKLMGPIASGWVQLDPALGCRGVAPGFSGAPVWDTQEKAVVGMIVSMQARGGETSAYMIPVGTLCQVWPALRAQFRLPRTFTTPEAERLAAFRRSPHYKSLIEYDTQVYDTASFLIERISDAALKDFFLTLISIFVGNAVFLLVACLIGIVIIVTMDLDHYYKEFIGILKVTLWALPPIAALIIVIVWHSIDKRLLRRREKEGVSHFPRYTVTSYPAIVVDVTERGILLEDENGNRELLKPLREGLLLHARDVGMAYISTGWSEYGVLGRFPDNEKAGLLEFRRSVSGTPVPV
jgi:hypothetical protein